MKLLESLMTLTEATPIRVKRVRNKKIVIKWECPDGYKVDWPGKPGEGKPRCVRMTAAERRRLSKRNRLAAKRARAKRKLAAKKAKRSRSKGERMGLYRRNKAKRARLRR